jgi:DNA-binding LacI/PurR family transcriptional regulator/DNA-binding transcriptional regulator YhcF (GntR family)
MAVHIPKYVQVKEAILADIRSGKYKTGDKLPIREELIKQYSVTRTTIDKALRELIDTGLLKASRKLGTFVAETNYKKQVAIISTLSDPLSVSSAGNDLPQMIFTVMSMAQNVNIDFFIPNEAINKLNQLARYDFIIWTQPDAEAVALLKEFHQKVIIINRYYDNMGFISTNHRQAIQNVTELLINNCPPESQLFYLTPSDNQFIITERREGFIDACSKHQRFYRICESGLSNFTETTNYLCSLPFKKGTPVILVSSSCNYTGSVLAMLREKKFSLYNDFFYADFDNNNALHTIGRDIVTITQDYKQMGIEIVNALNKSTASETRCMVPHKIKGLKALGC